MSESRCSSEADAEEHGRGGPCRCRGAGFVVPGSGGVPDVHARLAGCLSHSHPSDYHPSFFRDYRLAQAQKAAWLTNALEVASRYAGATQPCLVSRVKSLPASEGQAVFVFENKCQAGVFAARKRRVELARRDGVWVIVWTGVTFKCWGNPSEPGTYLISHNPFRRSGTPSAALVNGAVKDIGYTLNPWHGQCPP